MKRKTPLALIVLDGFGYRAEREGNAIAQAEMPYYRELLEKYPHTLLQASGKCREIGVGEIPYFVGRYYAMDRDKRWDRIERAYKLLIEGEGERATDPIAAIYRSYERKITDEFVEPIVMTREDGKPVATIQDGDSVIFFNF